MGICEAIHKLSKAWLDTTKLNEATWCPAALNDLSLHVFVELYRFLQTGKPPPQIRLVRHFSLVLHDLVSGFCHDVLDLSKRKESSQCFKTEQNLNLKQSSAQV